MNYYSNGFYPNYQTSNPYQGNQFSMQPQMNNFNSNYQMSLLGKIVDGEDVVKATEIPLGGFGVFPKADLNEIYIKTWNNDGTTQMIKYHPVSNENTQQDINAMLLEKLNDIESKLNNMMASSTSSGNIEKRKELNMSVY